MLRQLLASTALCALALAPAISYAPTASACGRAMELELRDATRLFADAENLLDSAEGDSMNLHMAAGTVDEAFEGENLTAKDQWWGRRLLAVAAIRSQGQIDPEPRPYMDRVATRSEAAKKRNLERATATLGRMLNSDRYRDDTSLAAIQAEGLAQVGSEDAAYEILADLADRDLLFEAPSFRTLADLEAARGDFKASTAHRGECKNLVNDEEACGKDARVALNTDRGTL